jgi:hypothetical protein
VAVVTRPNSRAVEANIARLNRELEDIDEYFYQINKTEDPSFMQVCWNGSATTSCAPQYFNYTRRSKIFLHRIYPHNFALETRTAGKGGPHKRRKGTSQNALRFREHRIRFKIELCNSTRSFELTNGKEAVEAQYAQKQMQS